MLDQVEEIIYYFELFWQHVTYELEEALQCRTIIEIDTFFYAVDNLMSDEQRVERKYYFKGECFLIASLQLVGSKIHLNIFNRLTGKQFVDFYNFDENAIKGQMN